MKNNKNVIHIFVAIFFFAYLILAYKPLYTELHLTPDWTLDISQEAEPVSTALNVLPFKLGQNAGWFTHEGKLSYISNFDYKATVSSSYLIPYAQNSSQLKVIDTTGAEIAEINDGGFPFVSEERIFLMLPGGSGFEYIGLDGSVKVRHQHTSPITAFNSSPKLSIAGFADGTLCTFDENMNEKYTLTPGGSDIEVILGAATSSQGNYFACVSGQNKQRFVLYKNEENHAKIVYHTVLKQSIVHQTLVYFSKDESTVYYNDASGLGIVDIKTGKESHIDINGRILDIQESPVANSFFVLSKKYEGTAPIYTITIIEAKKHKTGNFSFQAGSAFILTDENSLFIGKDTKISKLTISKE